MLSLRVFLTIKNKLSIQLHCTFVPRHNDVLLLKVFDHESQKGVRNQQIILCVWVYLAQFAWLPWCHGTTVGSWFGSLDRMLYTQLPAMFGPISCSTTFNRRSFVQMSFIALLKKHLFVRRKLRKCTKKTPKIPFIVICKFPKRFNRFRTTFELRSMIFFFIFLPTVFCHSFTLSFYSFKYESASTFSFFRQKL